MSKLRSISTSFWSDPFVEDLSPSEKLVFIYLVTNDKTNMLGIYEVSIKKISFETGVSKELVEKALKGFERLGKVKYIDNYVVLCNYLKHQHFNTNMKKSAIDVYCTLPEALKIQGFTPDRSNPLKAFETLSNRLGMVRKVEVEVEEEVEEEEEEQKRENEQKISNDAIASPPSFIPPTLEQLDLEFQLRNIALPKSTEEAEKFKDHYDSKGWVVGEASMVNWKAAVKGWARKIGKFDAPDAKKDDNIVSFADIRSQLETKYQKK